MPVIDTQTFALGSYQTAVDRRLEQCAQAGWSSRVWAKDHSVWSATPVPELTNRLGWLTLPATMLSEAAAFSAFAEEVRSEGTRHVVLLGMGGSSLAPEVLQATFGRRPGYPELIVLDSTHPDAVREVERRIDLGRTLFVVSSKSGGTSETTSFYTYFWDRCQKGRADAPTGAPGRHFIAITDHGTSLERLAVERGFRRVFNAQPDVGGRYSALTPFGLVPAALVGVDVPGLLDHAREMAEASGPTREGAANPSLVLGVALGELALAGRDKLTLLVGRSVALLPAWLEQLVAESTGKHGKGIVPVADEPIRPVDAYAPDRVFVSIAVAGDGDAEMRALTRELAAKGHPVVTITLGSVIDLGQEFFRWEFATAVAGAVLGIQPFDQPDVQLAKELARRAMGSAGGAAQGASTTVDDPAAWESALGGWLSSAQANDYIGLQAYLPPSDRNVEILQQLRDRLGCRTGLATTLGIGPRFLHSTGQLHKGGPNTGLFLQLTDEPLEDLTVPETTYTFGELIRAQAAGDALALEQRGRRLLRLSLKADPAAGLERLLGSV
jgi:transaldolase / glucose-6-phosphate isomerase